MLKSTTIMTRHSVIYSPRIHASISTKRQIKCSGYNAMSRHVIFGITLNVLVLFRNPLMISYSTVLFTNQLEILHIERDLSCSQASFKRKQGTHWWMLRHRSFRQNNENRSLQ